MKERCLIAFEIGYEQSSDIISLVNKYLANVTIKVKKDLSEKDRMLFIFKNLE
jgi:methylase of polypeptide subunit release factors